MRNRVRLGGPDCAIGLAGWVAGGRRGGRPTGREADGAGGLDEDEVAGGVVEAFVAGFGADDDVLDAGAVRARVDARFDGERHARLQGGRVTRDDVRVLVRFEADAVADRK